ncbi:MAG: peptide chain release factor N(5)-glutamine methyltransferase [Gammaproteobacteria bacterium]|nr:peptide chain release factor N(5)-glutamine methyltransferase [Gammaproteobacteria bacterium]
MTPGAETVGALLAAGQQELRQRQADAALLELEAQVLLAHALDVSRSVLVAHPERVVPARAASDYRALLRRRVLGEPLAYLTGRREFWSLELEVNPHVLIPRPETEGLVERALALGPGSARVADLGTGSGAIALALARERPDWQLIATDRSPAALEVAQRNAARLGIPSIRWRLGAWFEALPAGEFDLILSNPPYVAETDAALDALRFEPQAALSAGPDGLSCLRLLAQGAPRYLRRGGWLILEHGAMQGAAVRAALVATGFTHVRSHPDLAGHERITEGQG